MVTGIAERLGVELPIAREVDAVLRGAATVEDAYRGLTRTAPGHEIHGAAWRKPEHYTHGPRRVILGEDDMRKQRGRDGGHMEELAPGKFVVVKMLVPPVLIGSPVASPSTTWLAICVLAAEVNELIRRNEPPKFKVCAPITNVRLSLKPLVGVLRREVERRL